MNIDSPIRINARAPVRMDLSGGTLDIWPIYLLLNKPTTVNAAIDLFAKAELEIIPSSDFRLELFSVDQNLSKTLTLDQLEKKISPKLQLHLELTKYFLNQINSKKRSFTLRIKTEARSPAGAGLGGSSSLAISIAGCLHTWFYQQSRFEPEADATELISIVKDVETQILGIPAGLQDYYAAVFGGIQCLEWDRHVPNKKSLKLDFSDFHSRFLLFYSGKSRNSGINNWELTKKFIDRNPDTLKKFKNIALASLKVERSLIEKDWMGLGKGIEGDWKQRSSLGKGISTPEIQKCIQKLKKFKSPPLKICGAGGGGCFFVYLPPSRIQDSRAIVQELEKIKGVRQIPFRFCPDGLLVNVSRED